MLFRHITVNVFFRCQIIAVFRNLSEVFFLRDTNTYSCDEKCPENANCLGVHMDQITKFICQCDLGWVSTAENQKEFFAFLWRLKNQDMNLMKMEMPV